MPPPLSASPAARATSSVSARSSRRDWLFAAGVLAAVIIAYLPVWRAGFIWDDDSHLTNNPCIIGPLGFTDIWTSAAGFYFPLVTSTFWVLHALCGLNPLPYHLVNVLLHAADAILLWLVLRRLGVRGAWLGALLWALHPVQVESVAWISELKNTQSAVWYLLSIWLYLRWTTESATPTGTRRVRWYALSVLCGAAAILSKSSTVMLPVVLALCGTWITRRWRWGQVWQLTPYLALSLLAAGWTIWEQKHHSGAIGVDWNQSLAERLIIAGNDVWFYLGKLVWPHPLIFIYPRWAPDATAILDYIPLFAAAAGMLALWWWRDRVRAVFFVAAYFIVSLFPVLGFFNVYFFRYSFVGDHFQYLANMGALALAGAAMATGLEVIGRRRAVVAAGGVVATLLGLLTMRQAETYRDNATLFGTVVARNPACSMAYYNLGKLRYAEGNFAAAIEHYEKSLQVDPQMADAQTALAIALDDTGQRDEALKHFEEALRLDPKYAVAHDRLGVVLAKAGRLPEAIEHFQTARQLAPTDPEVLNNLGNALCAAGRVTEGIATYESALRVQPRYAPAQHNLANALRNSDRMTEALRHYEEAVSLDPASPEISNDFGIALLIAERPADAIAQFERALQINPNLGPVHLNLAMALEILGRTAEARTHYEAARRLGVALPPANE